MHLGKGRQKGEPRTDPGATRGGARPRAGAATRGREGHRDRWAGPREAWEHRLVKTVEEGVCATGEPPWTLPPNPATAQRTNSTEHKQATLHTETTREGRKSKSTPGRQAAHRPQQHWSLYLQTSWRAVRKTGKTLKNPQKNSDAS